MIKSYLSKFGQAASAALFSGVGGVGAFFSCSPQQSQAQLVLTINSLQNDTNTTLWTSPAPPSPNIPPPSPRNRTTLITLASKEVYIPSPPPGINSSLQTLPFAITR